MIMYIKSTRNSEGQFKKSRERFIHVSVHYEPQYGMNGDFLGFGEPPATFNAGRNKIKRVKREIDAEVRAASRGR